MNKRVWAIAVLTVGLLALWLVIPNEDNGTSSQLAQPGFTVGKAAPALALTALDGSSFSIDRTGGILVLNFWASWCPPCREEMPELERFAASHKQDIRFAAVNLQESPETVRDYLTRHQYSMPVLLDPDGKAAAAFGIRAIPTTLVIDAGGVIRFRKSGPVSAAELERIVGELKQKS
ncbi:MAG: TlpA disulfide reductase family protein [Sporomusaceae bacterium]|nr:TlpA disulfide reductase family protein [Sporomusaceae bacterium]